MEIKTKTLRQKTAALRGLCMLSLLLVATQAVAAPKPPIDQTIKEITAINFKSHEIAPLIHKLNHYLVQFRKCINEFMDIKNKTSLDEHIASWRVINAEIYAHVIAPLEAILVQIKHNPELAKDVKKLEPVLCVLKIMHVDIERACRTFLDHSKVKRSTDLDKLMELGDKLKPCNHLLPTKYREPDFATIAALQAVLAKRYATTS